MPLFSRHFLKASEASYVYILSGQKLLKLPIWQVFEKQCYQKLFSLLLSFSNSEIGHVFCCRALNGRGWKWIAHTLALVSTLQCRSFSLSTHAEFQKLDGHLLASQFLKILGKLTCSRARKKDYNGGQ